MQQTSLNITDEIRQAVLLAEGVAHSLLGDERHYMLAIDCFRQLQDWPGSALTEPLRQQAAYNEALVWRALGSHGQCVLMLITLLGKRAPDTVEPACQQAAANHPAKPALPEGIALPSRLACLAAFARYDRNDLDLLPKERAQMLIDDAEKLVEELHRVENREGVSAHDRRLARYMYVEALRSIGHVELQHLKAGSASRLYQGQRPLGLKTQSLTLDETNELRHALSWMLTCEQFSPNCDLFCDLAEAYILLKEFSKAEGFARHATLRRNPDDERAYYLATESCLLQNTSESAMLARKYAASFNGSPMLDEFKSIRAELGIG